MPLQFERLESRCLLAAGINLAGGVLNIEGDQGANGIFVHNDGEGLFYAGLDRNGDGDFDDPGDILKVYSAEQVRSIVINAKGGDDLVLVELGESIRGDLVINTGAGADTVQIEGAQIGRNLRVNTGAGDDQLVILDAQVGRDAILRTAAGDDLIRLDDLAVDRHLIVHAQAGDDAVRIEDVSVGARLNVNLGAGQDILWFAPSTLIYVPTLTTLDGGGGKQDRLVTIDQESVDFLESAGARIKRFEFKENVFQSSPATVAQSLLTEHRLQAGEARVDAFHDAVHEVLFPDR